MQQKPLSLGELVYGEYVNAVAGVRLYAHTNQLILEKNSSRVI